MYDYSTPLLHFSRLLWYSRSARGARADLHAPKAPKSRAEMEAEAAAEELMAKHREVSPATDVQAATFAPCLVADTLVCTFYICSVYSSLMRCCFV